MENVNRNHKNSVFSSLFSTPDILRELYSAIEGVTIPPDIRIDINTLSNLLAKNLTPEFVHEITGLSLEERLVPNCSLRQAQWSTFMWSLSLSKRPILPTHIKNQTGYKTMGHKPIIFDFVTKNQSQLRWIDIQAIT